MCSTGAVALGFGQVGTVPLVVADPCFDDRLYTPLGGTDRFIHRETQRERERERERER